VDFDNLISIVKITEDQTFREQIPKIKTPWVLFLEPDEFIAAEHRESLLQYCQTGKKEPLRLPVERLVPKETMSCFSWVTTFKYMDDAADDIRRYHTLELRLLPAESLADVSIGKPPAGEDARFIIMQNKSCTGVNTACITPISRMSEQSIPKTNSRPADQDIFRNGHQKYFDDTRYSARFVWPHTVYHTIRYDHIPSIKKALRLGLSNPDLIMFTLVYLLRFRHFSLAEEIISLTPKHWFERSPGMTNAAATIHYISGHKEKALDLYRGLIKAFPDSDYIAENAIKMNLLANRYDAIDAIFKHYQEVTGNELKDDYYNQFKAVHGTKSPQKTATLSVCLIIRDEERTMEQAISSVKPIADEIIVVDTGSQDRSAEIASSLGARVYSFSWSDDFSAVRNFAIEKATCDYIFMLDGDEYISPFFLIESQTLKKLFPLHAPCAYSLQIGTYFNETDWLFLVREEGNFRIENTSIRIFPRLPGVSYSGTIAETPALSLKARNIPIVAIPQSTMQIVHDHANRKFRITRRIYLYNKLDNPSEETILTAIRDFAFLGQTKETTIWLRSFYNRENEEPIKIKMGLHLAKMLEPSDLPQADQLYRELAESYPGNPHILTAYAEFLIVNNRIKEISQFIFPNSSVTIPSDMACIYSLKYFESGDYEKASEILANVLETNAFHIFPQAIRFYYLTYLDEIEGGVSALDTLFTLIGSRKDYRIESIRDVFALSEELYTLMLKGPCRKECSLILLGIINLGKASGAI
jgi:glycosyltransferase involved in cell wall biosynthesis